MRRRLVQDLGLLGRRDKETKEEKTTAEVARRVEASSYEAFDVDADAARRPPLLRYTLALEDAFLARAAARVMASPLAGKRFGREWIPLASKIEPREQDDVWIPREDLKVLDDVCTKFCTHTFFPDANARVNTVINVLRLYDRLAEVGKLPFRIVFKGGVMLRLILLQFWQQQPLESRDAAIRYLAEQQAVTMGDFDFEIVPDRHRLSAEEVHRYVLVNYVVLLWLQRRMEAELRGEAPSGLLRVDFDREAARASLAARLQEAMDALPDSSHPLHGAKVNAVFLSARPGKTSVVPRGHTTRDGKAAPSKRRNLVVFACDEAQPLERKTTTTTPTIATPCVCDADHVLRAVGLPPMPIEGSLLYATCNTYINEDSSPSSRPQERRPLFHLSRIKHAFVLYYTTKDGRKRCDRLAGEMIDLSMGDVGDEVRAWKHETLGRAAYRSYPLLGVPKAVATLRTYSPAGYLADHEAMLHLNATPPWAAPKYSKRLVRYAAFLVVHVASLPTVDAHGKVRALRHLCAYLSDADGVRAKAMRPTRVPPVDHFARREHECARQDVADAATLRAYRAYLRTLHAHLDTLSRLYEEGLVRAARPTFGTLDVTQLDYMNRHVFGGR